MEMHSMHPMYNFTLWKLKCLSGKDRVKSQSTNDSKEKKPENTKTHLKWLGVFSTGADPGFFLGEGALVSWTTSTPINHIVFFLQNTSCIRKAQVISGGGEGVRTPCTLPLDPPLWHNKWLVLCSEELQHVC